MSEKGKAENTDYQLREFLVSLFVAVSGRQNLQSQQRYAGDVSRLVGLPTQRFQGEHGNVNPVAPIPTPE